ncbi:hypothetical protein B0H13DRAFT_1876995 [Mycena leptocephala]|nr:hypothetical protein B0H13DRAFT_1876995 [Mycena leptocephala]
MSGTTDEDRMHEAINRTRRRPRENEEKVPSENHPSPHGRRMEAQRTKQLHLARATMPLSIHGLNDPTICPASLPLHEASEMDDVGRANRRIQRRVQKPVKQAGVGRDQCAVATSLYLICSAPPGPVRLGSRIAAHTVAVVDAGTCGSGWWWGWYAGADGWGCWRGPADDPSKEVKEKDGKEQQAARQTPQTSRSLPPARENLTFSLSRHATINPNPLIRLGFITV